MHLLELGKCKLSMKPSVQSFCSFSIADKQKIVSLSSGGESAAWVDKHELCNQIYFQKPICFLSFRSSLVCCCLYFTTWLIIWSKRLKEYNFFFNELILLTFYFQKRRHAELMHHRKKDVHLVLTIIVGDLKII
jgi:hypothetical protein